jgi:hypothetical protein
MAATPMIRALHIAFKLVNRCGLRPPHDVERHDLGDALYERSTTVARAETTASSKSTPFLMSFRQSHFGSPFRWRC